MPNKEFPRLHKFSALPNFWIIDGKMKVFGNKRHVGESIAALKCLLALNTKMNFDSKLTEKFSYDILEENTALSRPMISRGLRKLSEYGLIRIERSGGKIGNSYIFLTGVKNTWSKIPKNQNIFFYLKNISNRGQSSLASLKVYLVLLSFRKNNLASVSMRYDTINKYTGLRNEDIKKGLQVLFEYQLIKVEQELDNETRRYKANSYTLIGVTDNI